MRRIVVVVALVFAALLVRWMVAQSVSDGGDDPLVNDAVDMPFCQSEVMFNLPEKRWIAYVKHPAGGIEQMEESVRRLPQNGMPDPLPPGNLLDHYEVLNTVCFSWPEAFDVTNVLYLGRARSLLEDRDAAITIFDMRRALMKLFFKSHWEEAERLFPLHSE